MKDATQADKPFEEAAQELIRLLQIMVKLRSPSGCPWDLKQNSRSLRPYLLEETHEVLEAIDADDPDWLCEELGDLLLQVVFHAQIHSETNDFTMSNVIRGIADKMERRHPHVFAGHRIESERQLRESWEAIKQKERNQSSKRSRSSSIPANLPALLRAQKFHAQSMTVETTEATYNHEKLPDDLSRSLCLLGQSNKQELEDILPGLLLVVAELGERNGIDCESRLQDLISKHLDHPHQHS